MHECISTRASTFWAIIELQSAFTGCQKEGIASQTKHWMAAGQSTPTYLELRREASLCLANTVRVLRFTQGNNESYVDGIITSYTYLLWDPYILALGCMIPSPLYVGACLCVHCICLGVLMGFNLTMKEFLELLLLSNTTI